MLPRIVAASAAALLLGMATLFAVRRLTGGLVEPLSSAVLLAVGAALVAVASLLRLPWLPARGTRSLGLAGCFGLLLPLPALLLFGAALTLPGAAPWSLAALWALLAAHEAAWGVGLLRGRAIRPPRAIASGRSTPRAPAPENVPPAEAASPAANVIQQFVRTREADGAETIAGVLRTRFAAGERTQSQHVAFCPPLDDVPALECAQIEGPAAKITLGEVQSYGARIDLRLSRPIPEPAVITVSYRASQQAKRT